MTGKKKQKQIPRRVAAPFAKAQDERNDDAQENRNGVFRSEMVKATKGKHGLRILVIDVGGTHVKVLATGEREERKVVSGSTMTPAQIKT